MRPGDPHILSRPHPIHFAGWKSNTFALQQAGWEFSASQSMEYDEVGLALRHPGLGLRGITSTISNLLMAQCRDVQEGPPLSVAWMTDAHVQFLRHHGPDWLAGCEPVDMRPQFVNETVDFDDMVRFAGVPLTRTAELVVDPDDVSAMMDRILTLQDPSRQERYREMAKQNRQTGSNRAAPRQNFHAQIVSLVA